MWNSYIIELTTDFLRVRQEPSSTPEPCNNKTRVRNSGYSNITQNRHGIQKSAFHRIFTFLFHFFSGDRIKVNSRGEGEFSAWAPARIRAEDGYLWHVSMYVWSYIRMSGKSLIYRNRGGSANCFRRFTDELFEKIKLFSATGLVMPIYSGSWCMSSSNGHVFSQ